MQVIYCGPKIKIRVASLFKVDLLIFNKKNCNTPYMDIGYTLADINMGMLYPVGPFHWNASYPVTLMTDVLDIIILQTLGFRSVIEVYTDVSYKTKTIVPIPVDEHTQEILIVAVGCNVDVKITDNRGY